jgi:hypothetical protein
MSESCLVKMAKGWGLANGLTIQEPLVRRIVDVHDEKYIFKLAGD